MIGELRGVSPQRITNFIKGYMRILFLTGAGLSANAGLPTYRGPDGVYTNSDFKIEEFMTFRNYKKNTEEVSAYMADLHAKFSGVQPSDWHKFIGSLQDNHNVLVVTQNIDGLHQAAGSKNVIELHGNAGRMVIREGLEAPDVVFFDDIVPDERFDHIDDWSEKGVDLAIAIGTTMQFSYLYGIVLGCSPRLTVLVDKDENHPAKSYFDVQYTNIKDLAQHIY